MRKKIGGIVSVLACLGIIIGLVSCDKKDNNANKELTVSIAASLKEPMDIIRGDFEKKTGIKVKINSGSSGTLVKQIQGGVGVDIFFSASKKYSDELLKDGKVYEDKVSYPLTNSLVVIGNSNLKSLDDLKNITGKIAIGETNTVPAGTYARESLEYYKIYNELENKFVYGKSATNVKEYVESGNAEYGFVYKSDATNLKNSKIVYKINDDSHKKIEYTLAILDDSKYIEEDKEFIKYLDSNEVMEVFEKYGFSKNK